MLSGAWIDGYHCIMTATGWVVIEGAERGTFLQVPDEYPFLPDNESVIHAIEAAVEYYGDEEYYRKTIFGFVFEVYHGSAWYDGDLIWQEEKAVNWKREAESLDLFDFLTLLANADMPKAKAAGLAAYCVAKNLSQDLLDRDLVKWEFLELWDNWSADDIGWRLIRYADMLYPINEEQFKTIPADAMRQLQVAARGLKEDGTVFNEEILEGRVPFGWRVE